MFVRFLYFVTLGTYFVGVDMPWVGRGRIMRAVHAAVYYD